MTSFFASTACRVRNWLALACACMLLPGVGAHAQDYPDRPVTLIVPYSTSQIDSFSRSLAKGLSDLWGQAVIVENRPGANEIIAADRVVKAKPDGLTVFIGTEAAYLLNPLLYKRLPYDPDSQLLPVSMLVRAPLVLVVPSTFPADSLKEFIDYARSRSERPITYGSPGVGGLGHLPYVGMARDQGIKLLHVPYKGGGVIMQDVIAGVVDSSLMGAGISEPFIRSGKIKALAISSNERLSMLPNVPTFAESGVRDINASYFLGLSVPAGTPQKIVDKIAADAVKVISSEDFKKTMLLPFGFTAVGSTPAQFAAHLKKEKPIWSQRVKDSGVALEM